MCLCMTHSLKAFRKLFLASNRGSTRNFTSADNVCFGWKSVVETYKRGQIRVKIEIPRDTDLVMAAVIPNSWNKMNVKYAKAPFPSKALYEKFVYLSIKLGFSSSTGIYFKGTHGEDKDISKKITKDLKY